MLLALLPATLAIAILVSLIVVTFLFRTTY